MHGAFDQDDENGADDGTQMRRFCFFRSKPPELVECEQAPCAEDSSCIESRKTRQEAQEIPRKRVLASQ